MSALYLTKLVLREFRTFAELEIVLPPTPGVVIVSGTNGLGKSSLFDALEWVLTGAIDRFQSSQRATDPHDYLRRWHADPQRPTSVSASFSDNVEIIRDLDTGLRSGPHQVSDVVELVQSADWQAPIHDLHRYLLLTHFLGQSTMSRMTHRAPAERWQFLQGPAQSEWAISLGNKLHGHGNSGVARAYEKRAAELETEAGNFENIVYLERSQFEGARLEGAVDEESALRRYNEFSGEIYGLASEFGISIGRNQTEPKTPDVFQEVLEGRLLEFHSLISIRGNDARKAGALFSEYQRISTEHASQTAAFNVASEIGIRRKEDEAKAATAVELALRAQTAASDALRARREIIENLARLQREVTDAVNLREAMNAALDAQQTAASDLQKYAIEVTRSQRQVQLSTALETKVAVLGEELNAIRKRRDLLNLIDQRRGHRANAIQSAADVRSRHGGLASQLKTAEQAVEAVSAKEARAVAELRRVRGAVDEITSAVAAIAARLSDDDHLCPVCATNFTLAADLRTRAMTAADRLSPTIVALEKAARAAASEKKNSEATLADAIAAHTEISKADAAVEENNRVLQDLLIDAGIGDEKGIINVERNQIELQLTKLDWRLRRAEYWLQHLGTVPILQKQSSQTILRRNQAASLVQTHRNSVDSIKEQIGALERKLRNSVGEATLSFEAIRSNVDQRLALEVAGLATLEAGAQVAQNAVQKAREQSDGSRVASGSISAEIESLANIAEACRARLARLETEWVELTSATAAPNLEQVRDMERVNGVIQARLDDIEKRVFALARGHAIWKDQIAHRATLAQLRRMVEVDDIGGRDAILAAVANRQNDLINKAEKFRRAKQVAQAAFSDITNEIDKFNQRYLKPLNNLMEKINRTILAEPEIGLDLFFSRKSVEQRARGSSNAPEYVGELDPLLVHSEGQMAALAVSMLCAASITFPWSRWRALVMDDPLQHNDALHAAAFADLLRNLVRERGYQVFLSTHDVAQADFLRRKFSAGGVYCTAVQLLGRGKRGVDVSIKPPAAGLAAQTA